MRKTSKKPKMGRPPLPPEKRKRPSMGFRPTAELRKQLEEAATASGLSLTQEIERRLERSFGEEENLRWAFSKIIGDEVLFQAMVLISSTIHGTEIERGLPWRDDPQGRAEAAILFKGILDDEAAGTWIKGDSKTGKNIVSSKLKSRRAPKRAKTG